MSFGLWIREKLLEAGSKGVTVADLHRERLEHGKGLIDTSAVFKGGTYSSFVRYFHWFKQLGFVEPTGEKEPSSAKGDTHSLESDRCYYKVSIEGRQANQLDWQDPIRAFHPNWSPYERKKRYYKPSGKPRGRPRRELKA